MPTVPTVTAATRPACGANEVDRKVTSAGPVTNTTSSKTLSAANAVCRSLATGSRWAQRARTMVPIWGIAAPESAAQTCGHGVAQSSTIETIIRVVVSAKATASTYSTRPWPNRSASRPCGIAKTALPTM